MPSLIAVSAIAGLSGLALANPVKIDKRSTFSIKQVPVSRSGPFPHPAQQMVRIYNKYGASQTIPEDVTRGAAAAETGEVSATPVQNDSVRAVAPFSEIYADKPERSTFALCKSVKTT